MCEKELSHPFPLDIEIPYVSIFLNLGIIETDSKMAQQIVIARLYSIKWKKLVSQKPVKKVLVIKQPSVENVEKRYTKIIIQPESEKLKTLFLNFFLQCRSGQTIYNYLL